MVKFKKGLLVITLVSLIMLSIRPFTINADTLSLSDVVGIDYELISYEVSAQPQTQTINGNIYSMVDYIYKFRVDLNRNYTGLVSGTFTYQYYNYTYTSTSATERLSTRTFTFSNVSVNGTEFYITDQIRIGQLINTNVQKRLTALDVYNLSSNGYFSDDSISGFPYESNNLILGMLYNGWNPSDLIPLDAQFEYPIFDISSSSPYIVWDLWQSNFNDEEYYKVFIFGLSVISGSGAINDDSSFKNYFHFYHRYDDVDVSSDFEVISSDTLFRSVIKEGVQMRVYKVVYNRKSQNDNRFAGQYYIKYVNSEDAIFLPIYFNYYKNTNISTDFALRFGLRNVEVDYYMGSPESQTSASNLESSTSSFSNTASNVYNVEDQVSSGFSSSMQNIPSSFNFQNNFGSSFVVSASWVRDQFNNMTANNPFGSLITFSLILGVALLIIGRLLS